MNDEIIPCGISYTQLNLLVELTNLSGDTLTESGWKLGMDRSTLTRNLLVLRNQGIITISREAGSDRRVKNKFALTEKGHGIVSDGVKRWEKANNKLLESVGKCEMLRADLDWFSEQMREFI